MIVSIDIAKMQYLFFLKAMNKVELEYFLIYLNYIIFLWMWELNHKESWVSKNWCFWTMVLEKTFESSLDCEEIQPVHPKGNQSWIFIARTDAEAETPILWPPDAKNWLLGKDSDAGKDWRQKEKGTTEDEMAGWHHWLYGHEFEQAMGVGGGHGGLACCSPWSHKESDMTEQLNQTDHDIWFLSWSLMSWAGKLPLYDSTYDKNEMHWIKRV